MEIDLVLTENTYRIYMQTETPAEDAGIIYMRKGKPVETDKVELS